MRIRYLQLHITPELDALEVNTLLRRHLGLSGTVLRRIKWLEDGILLDGERVTVRRRVSAGQTLSVRLSDPPDAEQPVPTPGPLDILYEDEDLVVVNKQPGILIHPSHGHYEDTLGNYLMAHYAACDDGAGFHPVHRLDKGTSGILVAAKHPHGQERLKAQLHTGAFRRRYLAVCEGCPPHPEGTVDAPIALKDGSLMAREIRADGQKAITHYRVLDCAGGRSLVELELETGRTHQIRLHMAHIGCPLTGDFLYGREDTSLISRPALHSRRTDLIHPLTGRELSFTAPLPQDISSLIERSFPHGKERRAF
ncbi:MAG: RluA family pseudouridine synthase [Oscillospiraceae bacterium]|nr:RluA family pseudouridine synthase [Oscillospiraceae bacterium]